MASRTHEVTVLTVDRNLSGFVLVAEAKLMDLYAEQWQIVGQSESADSITWTLYREVIHDDVGAAE